MDQLRLLFDEIGLGNPQTFQAAGNVVFDTDLSPTASIEALIEEHLHRSLGFEVDTCVRSAREMQKIVRLAAGIEIKQGAALHVAFLKHPPERSAVDAVMEHNGALHQFHHDGRELYWLTGESMATSKLGAGLLERLAGQPMTLRNANTVLGLAQRFALT